MIFIREMPHHDIFHKHSACHTAWMVKSEWLYTLFFWSLFIWHFQLVFFPSKKSLEYVTSNEINLILTLTLNLYLLLFFVIRFVFLLWFLRFYHFYGLFRGCFWWEGNVCWDVCFRRNQPSVVKVLNQFQG